MFKNDKKLQNIKIFQIYYFCSRTNFIDISTFGNLLLATAFVIYRINQIFLVRYRAKSYYFNENLV